MIDLLAALVAAVISAAPTPAPDRIDVPPVVVEAPPAASEPSGWVDVCVPDDRPGVVHAGTTAIGAVPCEPTEADRARHAAANDGVTSSAVTLPPTGWIDPCVEDPRWPGSKVGTTRVGATPCTIE